MTLMCLQYPAVIIAFVLCELSVIAAARLPRLGWLPAPAAGLSGAAAVFFCFFYGVPMGEILLLLLVILLTGFLAAPKEDRS
ncbi:MAG: hypothetical protein PUB93_07920 [Firmicutes bacterium]|nr:hypothetical protein [Bacillota bacterium]